MWDFTSRKNTLNEGWCETVVWDFTSHNNTLNEVVMAAWILPGLCFGEEAGARNLAFFRVKWLQPAMKGTCVCGGCGCGRSGRDGFLLCVLQRVVASACVVLCVSWKSVVEDRIGMAAWLLSSGVAMRVERDAGLLGDAAKRIVEGSLEVKLPTIWTDEKQSRAEAERRERLEERRVEEKESEERRCRCAKR